MIYADWHPDDERLLDRYLDPTAADEACDRHMAGCRHCRTRFAALASGLERAHASARAAADTAFDPARLERQHAAILARLGAETRGRLLSFPARARASWRDTRLTRPARAAAAVALLAVAIGGWAGQFVTGPGETARSTVPPVARAEFGAAGGIQTVAAIAAADESIFSDIDLALAQPRTAELRALDDLTPHARDAVAPVR